MRYIIEMTGSSATIGYLACRPDVTLSAIEALHYLTAHPLDEYMHKHLLMHILNIPVEEVKRLVSQISPTPVVTSLLAEGALQRSELAELVPRKVFPAASPLINLRQEKVSDMGLHRAWSTLFARNLLHHTQLPELERCPALPYSHEEINRAGSDFRSIENFVAAGTTGQAGNKKDSSPDEASHRARKALEAANVRLEKQMPHQLSLSPVGLVREWYFEVSVKNGSLDYVLQGSQASFGRGLKFDRAQAGLLMEICERFSSWAAFGLAGALGYTRPLPLIRARYAELTKDAVNPKLLPLEVPYKDEVLHWVAGSRPDDSQVLVPAQFVFLFANLDEPALCSGIGSTGLGAGLDMARARVTALLEVIERDAESVAPHHLSRCFRIESENKEIAALLAGYAKQGIEVFFEDITPELGVPCYRAFATGPEGQVTKGASANLNGPEACVSAMLEIPYPYPWGPPSLPAPQGLPLRLLEELPTYSTGNFAGDLAILEAALTASGHTPVYIDLTREDMNIPVCRALIPGLELMADFDRHSRLSPRLFRTLLQGSCSQCL